MYDPQQGRFLENDPNGLGLSVAQLGHGGVGLTAETVMPDVRVHYRDGMNSHVAYGASPLLRQDPAGLDWDPFSMADDFLEESAASQAAFMANVRAGLH
jgi:hypothetical protein